ncbi:MAG: S8 family serine peptidase [Actinomycetota bacterium]|nr:S8 family serine peptidase [Actinomycetota bacterium]
MTRILLLSAALAAAVLLSASTAGAATYVPGEVIVKYRDGTSGVVQQDVEQTTGTDTLIEAPGGSAQLEIEDGDSVPETVDELQSDPSVAYARPNYVARASAFLPDDPAFARQWNLNGPFGLNMPEAWDLAAARGAPGGEGAVVAVLDTGVAYENRGRYRRAPDLRRFVRGYDFVDFDRHPNDQNGHGTHVSGTIAQTTNNGVGTAGIAYRARIMPVRVLDADGAGDTFSISRGLRFAARRKVDVINLSLEFDSSVRASQIPDIVSALRYARKKGVVVVAAAGNQASSLVAYPARARTVIGVAATTMRGCQADYSNSGIRTDLAAPGGGVDANNSDNAYDAAVCRPLERGSFIFQQTFTTSVRRFGLPPGYEGTSMAAPHVAGAAALVIASRRLGANPGPADVERLLENTARDIGEPGFDNRYGKGLLDVAAALRDPSLGAPPH